ncbi:MAG TPA: hypothetical protein VFX98_19415 [Longimicrobiaceae bacterium]|nr:hypothetical protein [Longimicrobiaceae bacterium]
MSPPVVTVPPAEPLPADVVVLPSPAAEAAAAARVREEARWQRRVLPIMAGMLLFLTLAFLVMSVWQMERVQREIASQSRLDSLVIRELAGGGAEQGAEMAQFRAVLALEATAMQRRYHQAGLLLLTRIWTRYMGFITGMIMALVGCAFVLGKIHDPEAELKGSGGGAWLALRTSSPGVILAVLGTVLMSIASAVRTEVAVQDVPVFTPLWAGARAPAAADTAELPTSVLDEYRRGRAAPAPRDTAER